MNPEDCLPAHLRGPATTITALTTGLSGAGVYRVDAAGGVFVLKVAGGDVELEGWRRRLHVQQLAADAGVAPRIVHVDEGRRAVLSVFVDGPAFAASFMNPHTRGAALAQLGQTIRRVHEIPLPPGAEPADPRDTVSATWAGLAGFAVPAFVADAVERVLAEEPPSSERAPVLSHNDVNPGNLLSDGANLLLVDWDVAGPNDPFYDLAAISVFLRMDPVMSRALLAAYDGEPVSSLPLRFAYDRRLVAVLCGAASLRLAGQRGHPGAAGGETIEATPGLGDFYQRMRAGEMSLATGNDGLWAFGLALVKEGFTA